MTVPIVHGVPGEPFRAVAIPDVTACPHCGHPEIPTDHPDHGRHLKDAAGRRNAGKPKPPPSPWMPQAGERRRRDAADRLPPLEDGRRDPLDPSR